MVRWKKKQTAWWAKSFTQRSAVRFEQFMINSQNLQAYYTKAFICPGMTKTYNMLMMTQAVSTGLWWYAHGNDLSFVQTEYISRFYFNISRLMKKTWQFVIFWKYLRKILKLKPKLSLNWTDWLLQQDNFSAILIHLLMVWCDDTKRCLIVVLCSCSDSVIRKFYFLKAMNAQMRPWIHFRIGNVMRSTYCSILTRLLILVHPLLEQISPLVPC